MPTASVENWAQRYIETDSLSHKLSPPAPPQSWEAAPVPQRIAAPGRPAELSVAERAVSSPDQLNHPTARAKLLHSFFHHELQAAELMCWALLAFADAEPEFRRGLLGICQDEIRHMSLYREQIGRLGHEIGDFKVRDWFWQRIPTCAEKVQFVALMGMGLEAANLEHGPNFAARFGAVGDFEAARVQQRVAREEIAHVRFGTHWFERWTGGQDFDEWQACLPPPLSPLLMRGSPLSEQSRRRAGMSPTFIDALKAWQPEPSRS